MSSTTRASTCCWAGRRLDAGRHTLDDPLRRRRPASGKRRAAGARSAPGLSGPGRRGHARPALPGSRGARGSAAALGLDRGPARRERAVSSRTRHVAPLSWISCADFQAQPRLYGDRRPAAGDRRRSPRGSRRDERFLTLLGATGTGKTFTMAGTIERLQRPGARDRPQQDARRAALQRVPRVLPRQRGRVLRQLLRLLPARGLRPGAGPLHREGLVDQRRDRPPAPLRHRGAVRPARRGDRRLGLVHLRDRLARAVPRADAAVQGGRVGRPRRAASASWSGCSTRATTPTSPAAPSGSRASCSRSSPPTPRPRTGSTCSATRSRRSSTSTR